MEKYIFQYFNRISKDAISNAQKKGVQVTCSTSPHYFSLDEADIKKWRTFSKLFSSRDKKNLNFIKEGIVNNIITCITSDHSPHDTDSKRLPFEIAAPGSIGFESLLPLTLNFSKEKTRIIEVSRTN